MLNDIAQVFSIVSSVGVFLSLIFVAIQVRDSTRAGRAATYQNIMNAWNEYLLTLLQDSQLLRIRDKGMYKHDELSNEEVEIFSRLCEFELGFHENMLYQRRIGFMDSTVTIGWEAGFEDWINRPGPRTYWERRKDIWNPDLRDFVSKYLRRSADPE